MLNFPIPYPDELIYSTVARSKVRAGITSPKKLLDDVFADRKVVATVDIPCHLSKITKHYPTGLYDVSALAYKHTLFPLYALFIPENRRQKCIDWMSEHSQGAIHLAIGKNASRLPPIKFLRFCPICLDQQLAKYGEWYWSRLWQIQGLTCCLLHGRLLNSSHQYRPTSRHEFIAPAPHNCKANTQIPPSADDIFIAKKVNELLHLPSQTSPSYEQWSDFYKKLAADSGCLRGSKHIHYDKVVDKIKNRWPDSLLKQYSLNNLEIETSWLHGIFRKHRKSFSYLEHMIVIEAMLINDWSFKEVLKLVKAQKPKKLKTEDEKVLFDHIDSVTLLSNRELWIQVLKEQKGIKSARAVNQSLYAWLYRNDKAWLMITNKKNHNYHIPEGTKIDWNKRDIEIVRLLIEKNKAIIWDMYTPRRSKKWWMQQTNSFSIVEKNLDKLPLVAAFLGRYGEDVSDYQIRRLTRVLIDSIHKKESLSHWVVLRQAKLSEQRMTSVTKRFLKLANSITDKAVTKVSL
ncbi:TnsD family Tn7-like transposition protein [Psychrobacter arenosus]|uniref:TnsD family Tn7-like transposition protein n=1 Tax=Psychrobacter arenosus TaxID=256326 RepID=UPI0019181336|nr:TnsD family Tn7-like transposition protein [Psychrobacter arenosus]